MIEALERDDILTSAGVASRRTRQVLMLLQLFTLLILVMVFNSCQLNWTDSRLKTTRLAVALYDCVPDDPSWRPVPDRSARAAPSDPATGNGVSAKLAASPPVTQVSRQLLPGPFASLGSKDVIRSNAEKWADSCKAYGVSAGDIERLRDAAVFNLRKGYTREDVEEYVSRLERFRMDNVLTVPVPLVGVRLDVNGLGVFAGLGVSILLVWFGLSLSRERDNLRVLYTRFRKQSDVLLLLRMETLFAPHHSPTSPPWRARILHGFGASAMLFPALLLGVQLRNDIKTFEIGREVHKDLTLMTVSLESGLFALNLLLAGWCVVEYYGILAFWSQFDKEDVEFEAEEANQSLQETAGATT